MTTPTTTSVTTPVSIRKLLIANRGEIASRIIRTARAMDITTVAVFSDPDAGLPYVVEADESVRLPGSAPGETYLRGEALIAAAAATGADAVHPGYGFLSENAGFARACAAAGLTFVGPSPGAIEAMGSKTAAKELMAAAGVPVLPGAVFEEGAEPDPAELRKAAEDIGFPVLVKAAYGGGGRGMRIVASADEIVGAVASARREAASAFGNGTVFLERFVESPRHIEVQILGDQAGTVAHLFERECSIQRRYQKIIEEAPSPAVGEELRAELCRAAVAAGRAIGYAGAGTVEFVLDSSGRFYFLEVNTRLQVEHPVTELITGLDLVRLQLEIASGQPLPPQVTAAEFTGHAIEARLYAEDVPAGYLPASGDLHTFEINLSNGLRVDTGFASGTRVSTFYDSMLAKVIGYGPTRDDAQADAGRGAVAGPAAWGRDQPGPAGGHPARAGVHRGRDRHRLPGPAPACGAVPGRGGGRARAPAGRGPGRAGPAARGGPGAGHAALGLAEQPQRPAAGTVRAGRPARRGDLPPRPGRAAGRGGRDRPGRRGAARHPPGARASGARADAGGSRSRRGPPGHRRDPGRRHVLRGQRAGAQRGDRSRPLPRPGGRGPGRLLLAPMPGTVVRVEAAVGDHVKAGAVILAIEAMKMEHAIRAPVPGIVTELPVSVGTQVDSGSVLAVLEEPVVEGPVVEGPVVEGGAGD